MTMITHTHEHTHYCRPTHCCGWVLVASLFGMMGLWNICAKLSGSGIQQYRSLSHFISVFPSPHTLSLSLLPLAQHSVYRGRGTHTHSLHWIAERGFLLLWQPWCLSLLFSRCTLACSLLSPQYPHTLVSSRDRRPGRERGIEGGIEGGRKERREGGRKERRERGIEGERKRLRWGIEAW